MRLPIRATAHTEVAQRLATPELRPDPVNKKKRIPQLCWVDESSNHQRRPCSRELFKMVAGENEVGERPDGMDRISNHEFVIHLDANNQAVGVDVIPSRKYGGKMVPTHLVGVKTLKLHFLENGSGVVRVLQHPVNTPADTISQVILALDAMNGRPLKIGMTPVEGNAAKIVSLADGVVELKLSARASRESVHSLLDD